jgi:hypothetical protein
MLSDAFPPARNHQPSDRNVVLHVLLLTISLLSISVLNACSVASASSTLGASSESAASAHRYGRGLELSGTLPPAEVGVNFSSTLNVSGGTAPYTFSISWGELPPGLTLNTKTGTISGQATQTGTYNFGIHVTDPSDQAGGHAFAITVTSAPSVIVTITPTTATVPSGASTQFTALVTNTSNLAVTWFASSGTVSSTGLYQAPTVTVTTTTTVTATSVADPTKSATASVTVTPPPPPPVSITTTSLSTATASASYSNTLTATGGKTPYTWTLSSGSLPSGITLQSAGSISGTTSKTGSFTFTVKVTDSSSPKQTSSKSLTLTVDAAVAVSITPTSITVASGASTQFTAVVINTSNLGVTWFASAGTISSAGLYQAPTVTTTTTATVTATSVADPTKSATATVTVTPPPPPPVSITTTSLPGATAGASYSNTLTATGGKTPYTWTLSSGSLPTGITLQSSGSISGTTSQTGSFNITIQVTDSSSPKQTSSKALTLTVAAAVAVSITPTTAIVVSGASEQFTALVTNTSNVNVTWGDSSGTISSAGLYQAPTVTSTTTTTVTATSVADPTKSATAYVTVTPPPPPPVSVTTTSLSSATAGTSYSNNLSATGGTTPYTWTLSSGSLPSGITVQSSGAISGTTSQTGSFNITVQVTDSSSPKQNSSKALTLTVAANTSGGSIPLPRYFGFSESDTNGGGWPSVSYGMQRLWDSPPLQWPSINTASGVFEFTSLDSDLALAYSQGAKEIMYTLARTPPWATADPSDASCNYTTGMGGGLGECDPPSDLNSDGSGTNAIWKAFITAIATHANSPGYTATHAHIMYWEIWNEPDTKAFWAGSIAQLARLTEDANCIITGRGVIHESGNGTATPCTATAIDPTAQIVMSSAHAKGAALKYGQNELYCNDSPSTYQLPCPNPPNAIATAVDIINFHMKPGNESGNNCPAPTPCTPESAMQMYVSNVRGMLQPAELLKPLWDGEAQYSTTGFSGDYLTNTDLAASFMPRFYLINWTLNISGMAWYSASSQAEPVEAQTSYQQAYNWLSGASLTTPCAAVGTVWSCGLAISGKPYLVMWDTSQTCASGSCSSANQTVSSQWTYYQDMTTASTPITISGSVVPVGIKPVLLN